MSEEEKKHQHEVIISVKDVDKNFYVGKNIIPALKNVNLTIHSTDFVVVYGPSGCGKSTLFNIILGLEKPTKGDISIRDKKIYQMDDDERAKFRAKKIGVIYQMSYWVKSLNVVENVALPLIIEGGKEHEAIKHAKEMLHELGISNLQTQMPMQLSGGQQQKVGLARALISNPWILLADEPTGNLDSGASDETMAIFDTLNKKHRRTIIMVTHNQAYWNLGNRRIEMKDGAIVEDSSHG
jgi:putative ABC transport system ATP-binding protein